MQFVYTATTLITLASCLVVVKSLIKFHSQIPPNLKMKGLFLEVSALILLPYADELLSVALPAVSFKWLFLVEKILVAATSILLAIELNQAPKISKHLQNQNILAQKLQESERRFQLYMDNSPAIKYIKYQGKIIYQNNRFRDIYGDLIGLDYERFLGEYSTIIQENDRKVLETKKTLNTEETFLLPDGTSRIYNVSKFWMDEDTIGVTAFDITEQKEIFAELEELTYIASHDLRSPLRTIKGFVEYVIETLTEIPQTAEQKEKITHYTTRIVAAVDRMGLLLEGLLLYNTSRRAVPALLPISLQECYENATEDLLNTIQEKNAIIHCSTPLPMVIGDKVQLTQVFQNLIANAIKFCPPDRQPLVKIEYTTRSRFCLISIADNGIGIDKKDQDKIFNIFQKLNGNDYSGTGLGLAICKKIIKNHQGNIYVKSQLGEGSTFYFTLKICNPQTPSLQKN